MSDDSKPLNSADVLSIIAKVDKLTRHIENVQEACQLLGKRFIAKGEIDFGINLISNGQVHDASKWRGIEWDYLVTGDFNGHTKLAVEQHNRTNCHHPEYWGGIELMPKIYVAEMCCDWKARANEFGTDVWTYVKEKAIPRFGISCNGKVYKWIKECFDMLLDEPFSEKPSKSLLP
jgi:hypothetical protein